MSDRLHALAEDVSLELHRAVAERLLEEPALVERARQRVAGWLRDRSVARPSSQAILGRYPEAPAELLVFAEQIDADSAT